MLEPKLQEKIIENNRQFTMGYRELDPYIQDFESDQDMKKPQPPLVKAPLPHTEKISLTRDFPSLELKRDIAALFYDRKSSRVFSGEDMSLTQLSFLLWATQGVKKLRGKSYATLRTAPSGGARHPFELYLAVFSVDGLKPGAYHYLPMEHTLEYLHPIENIEDSVGEALSGQSWAGRANVVFFYSFVPYRAEWRYGIYAHRVALIDLGHAGENLYLACTATGLGACAIAAFSHEKANALFDLDGQEEYIAYTIPVGTVREQDSSREDDFYRFVREEGL